MKGEVWEEEFAVFLPLSGGCKETREETFAWIQLVYTERHLFGFTCCKNAFMHDESGRIFRI